MAQRYVNIFQVDWRIERNWDGETFWNSREKTFLVGMFEYIYIIEKTEIVNKGFVVDKVQRDLCKSHIPVYSILNLLNIITTVKK